MVVKELIELLDSPGGHILVCLLVITLGAAFCGMHVPKGEDLIIGGASALFAVMRMKGNGEAK